MDILALISAVAAVIGTIAVPLGYLQLKAIRAGRPDQTGAGGFLGAQFGDLSLFAPSARYRGFDVDLVDRRQESAALLRHVKAGRSVITIEGIAGAGKTALAARLCRQARGGRQVRWVFCDEKGAALTLTALAEALASGIGSPPAARLRAAAARGVGTSELADAVIDLLASQRFLLVFDNFHAVTDSGINELLARLRHSQTASSVVLTSRRRVRDLPGPPLVGHVVLHGLSAKDTRVLLRHRDVALSKRTAQVVWRRAGDGNPLALTLFAGRARETNPEELAARLPSSAGDFDEWVAMAFDELAPGSKAVAKIIAFAYEPTPRDIVRAVAAPLDPDEALADLTARFLVREHTRQFQTPGFETASFEMHSFEMHSAVRDYVTKKTTEVEQSEFAERFTDYYRGQARTVFIEGLGHNEPSYGTLYLESFPGYFSATDRHIGLVGDLLDRLADNGYVLGRGARILVLGSGDGTHDPGFAGHGFDVTNVEIQPEIADLGRSKAARLPAAITYVVADMTRPLPAELASGSMDAVFNIGSSFGYEGSDDANAMIFRNAASSLREGCPFVFEYVNGPHWENKRVQRQVDVTTLPNGSVRTEVSITNPTARTALTLIGLQRTDGTGGWFRHFMRYYRLNEILAMMADAGLQPVATYGATAGRVTGMPFDEKQSEAMVVIATRRAGE